MLSVVAILGGCGYHVGGTVDSLPKSVRTIAIPPFANITTRYKISDRLAGALTREFINRTRYKVVSSPEEADAVLRGSIGTYQVLPIIFDTGTGRATGIQISVVMSITLTERLTGKVLFQRNNFEVRERYEISVDQTQYFEESDPAVERLSRDVARSVVSNVLTTF